MFAGLSEVSANARRATDSKSSTTVEQSVLLRMPVTTGAEQMACRNQRGFSALTGVLLDESVNPVGS